MSAVPPAFLGPASLNVRRCGPLGHYSASSLSTVPRRVTRVVRRRLLCVAQEGKTPLSSSQSSGESSSASSPRREEDRKERARLARLEAERLELMAAKARLEFERAELQAERKRLELDKIRNRRESDKATEDTSVRKPKTNIDNPYDNPDAKANAVTATIKVGSNPPRKVTADSLSDLLSAEFPRVSESDIEIIKDKVCGMDTFFVTEVDRSPFDERVVLRGNMRMDASKLLSEVELRAKKEGIADRVRFFLLVDPKESPNDNDGLRRPVLVALPAAAVPSPTNAFNVTLSIMACLAAFVTSFSYGIGIFGFTPEVITQIARGNTAEALFTLPISAGTMALSLLHDAGHRIMAKLRDVKLGLPFFIPSLQIGQFGIITPFQSYARLRKDLFDIAAAGPIVGSACSLAALIAGLVITTGGETATWFPNVPTTLFHASILVGTIADAILPAGLREQATIAVHPLTIVGYTGLLVNALNLMPIGRLDGGRIMQALYGRAVAGRVTAVTLLIQAVGSLLGNSPLLLFWGLVCVFLQRESDIPCLNEVLEPDNTRTAVGLGLIIMMLLILIPFPEQVGDIISSL